MWQLDRNGNTLREMGKRGFTDLAAGTTESDVNNGQKIRLVLAFYKRSEPDSVSTIQYPVGQFGNNVYDGTKGILVDFHDPCEFKRYADGMGIKMCPPTKLSGYN